MDFETLIRAVGVEVVIIDESYLAPVRKLVASSISCYVEALPHVEAVIADARASDRPWFDVLQRVVEGEGRLPTSAVVARVTFEQHGFALEQN